MCRIKLVFLFNVGESISETTPFIEGPSDTSEMYAGSLFRSTLLRENIVESIGPVLSFTLQVPQAAIRSSDPVAQPGNLKLYATDQFEILIKVL